MSYNTPLNYKIFSLLDLHSENSTKPGFEYEDSDTEPLKEQSLWQSVIMQAIYDATSHPVNSKTRREKTQAIIWFSIQNKDFQFICEMAGMNPLCVLRGAKRAIKHSSVVNKRKLHMKRLRNASKSHKENDAKQAIRFVGNG